MKRWRPNAVWSWVACASLLLLQSVAFSQQDETAAASSRKPYQPLRTFQHSATGIDTAETEASKQSSVTVAVVGAVELPGSFSLSEGHHYLELINAAGGPSADAQRGVKIVRRGQVLMPIYDPKTTTSADAEEFGSLQDGDVVIVRPKTGVRTAYLETGRTLDAQGRTPDGNRPAQSERLAYVACIGLTSYPCVFPVDPQRSVLRLFLIEGLGLSESALSQVKLIPAAGAVSRDGLLTDGCTLIFDEGFIRSGQMSPDFPYPAPRAIKSTPREVVQPDSAIRIPGVPFLARESNPSAVPLIPDASVDKQVNGVSTHAVPMSPEEIASTSTASRAPLRVGVTPSSSTTDSSTASGLFERPLDGSTSTSPSLPETISRVHRGVITAAAIQGTSEASGPTFSGSPDTSPSTMTPPASLSSVTDASRESTIPEASIDKPETGLPAAIESTTGAVAFLTSDLFLGSLGLLAFLCLIGAQVWGKHQRHELAALENARTQQLHSDSPLISREPVTPLEMLIANRYPVIEEQVRIPLLPRYQGRSVGGKRLIINEAHSAIPVPHAAFTRPQGPVRRAGETVATGAKRSERLTRSKEIPTTNNASPAEPASEGIRFASSDFVETYDVIHPAESAGTDRTPRQPDGGLLERVLLMAQRERMS